MSPQESGYYENAVGAIARLDYDTAGDELARAAWETLADPRPDQDPFDAGRTAVTDGG